MGEVDNEFRAEIGPAIDRGEVVVLPNGDQYDRILETRYPWNIGQIAWSAIPAVQREHRHAARGKETQAIAEFFESVVRPRARCTDADRIVFIGDALDETTLGMSVATLLKYRGTLFSYPQHYFVIPPDGSWCFSYSFEADMFFAFAPR